MSSSLGLDQIDPSLETVETSDNTQVDADPSPFETTTGEKRKREGKLRSRVWQHFTKVEQKPGEREECRCNHCGHFYACSSQRGTTHLNRHIFGGGCPKYMPALSESQKLTSCGKDDEDCINVAPLRIHTDQGVQNICGEELPDDLATQLAQLKEENTRLKQERDDLAGQKTGLEQLILSMATETARLVEENTKLKEDYTSLQEEKQKTVTREEFTKLETQVLKLREDFERDRRGFPAATMAALAHLQRGR